MYISRIVGPKCLLTCFLNGEPIPEGTSPIYTTAMRGLCISVSGLTPEMKVVYHFSVNTTFIFKMSYHRLTLLLSQNQVQRLVEYMGAFFTKQLRNCVTHLVTNSVMSAKYEVRTIYVFMSYSAKDIITF